MSRCAVIRTPERELNRSWMTEAACRDSAVNFFPGEGDLRDIIRAKNICADCGVRGPCLEYALHYDEVGVWGGTTEYERNLLKGRKATTRTNPKSPR